MSRTFQPVILGTEIGAYGMARAFWQTYGVRSVCLGTYPLTPTAHSKFIDQRCDERLGEPEVLSRAIEEEASRTGADVVLVIPCGDEYAIELAEVAGGLDQRCLAVSSHPKMLRDLNDKSSFYAFCERAGVPYPRAVTVGRDGVGDLPFDLPVALKPTDAASFREHPFEGQQKAAIVATRQELEETISRAYTAGYDDRFVVQDFVPGDDSNMRVVNGYVRSDGSLALIALGNPVLGDCAPMRVGNYVAIVSYGDDAVYEMVERLVGQLDYFGFFNMDLKYDARDGAYKVLDFNPRAGRSSFYVTLSGHSMAVPPVEDLVEGRRGPACRVFDEVLWTGVPHSVVRRYMPLGPMRDRALALMAEGRVGTTLFGAGDNDPRRLANMAKLWAHYHDDFRRYGTLVPREARYAG